MHCRFCVGESRIKLGNAVNLVKSGGIHTRLIGLFNDKYGRVKLRVVYADVKEYEERRLNSNGEYTGK